MLFVCWALHLLLLRRVCLGGAVAHQGQGVGAVEGVEERQGQVGALEESVE